MYYLCKKERETQKNRGDEDDSDDDEGTIYDLDIVDNEDGDDGLT